MQAFQREVTFIDDRKAFAGVGSKKNNIAYIAQSFHQIGGGKKDDDDEEENDAEDKEDAKAEDKDEDADDKDEDQKGGKGKGKDGKKGRDKMDRKYQIFHKALPFGADKKVSLCDLIGKTLPLDMPLTEASVPCEMNIHFGKGQIMKDGKYLAFKSDEKRSIVWQDEEFGDWTIFKAEQEN